MKLNDPNRDIEAQPVSTAVPVTAVPVLDAPPYDGHRTTVIYLRDTPTPDDALDPHPELILCAVIGFIFSWIPIIGCITYLTNLNAPRNSMRSLFAQSACCIAMFVLIFNVIFWGAWNY